MYTRCKYCGLRVDSKNHTESEFKSETCNDCRKIIEQFLEENKLPRDCPLNDSINILLSNLNYTPKQLEEGK